MNRYRSFQTVAKLALILASIVLVQGILPRWLSVFSYFDLPLIYSVYYGFTQSRPFGSVVFGSFLGLMQDSLSGVALGTNGFTKTLVSFLSATTGSRFDVDQTITRVAALIVFTLLDTVLKVAIGALGRPEAIDAGGSAAILALSVVFNLLLGLVFFGYRNRVQNASA